jgi:hypothetical protein
LHQHKQLHPLIPPAFSFLLGTLGNHTLLHLSIVILRFAVIEHGSGNQRARAKTYEYGSSRPADQVHGAASGMSYLSWRSDSSEMKTDKYLVDKCWC